MPSKPVSIKMKKNVSPYKYRILDPQEDRRQILVKIIKWEAKNREISEKEAAISKKKHLNVHRIYRKNKPKQRDQVNRLTKDMRFLDEKYNLGVTRKLHVSKFEKNQYESDFGMMTLIWGPVMWLTMHTVSFNYPVNPSEQDKRNYKQFFGSLKNTLPCGKCRENLKKNLRKVPMTNKVFKNRDSLEGSTNYTMK